MKLEPLILPELPLAGKKVRLMRREAHSTPVLREQARLIYLLGAQILWVDQPAKDVDYLFCPDGLPAIEGECRPLLWRSVLEIYELFLGEVSTRIAALGYNGSHPNSNRTNKRFRNDAFIPVFSPVEDMAMAATSSRYFGSPWMPESEPWPTYDDEPMAFIMQLDLSTLPMKTSLPATGLLTLFRAPEGYEEDGSDSFVKVFDTNLPGGLRDMDVDEPYGRSLVIASWKEVRDYPHRETLRTSLHDNQIHIQRSDNSVTPATDEEFICIKIALEEIYSKRIYKARVTGGELYSEREILENANLNYGVHCFYCDKLSEHACWEQGEEVPNDKNGVPMVPVYQIELNTGMLLGDLSSLNHPNGQYPLAVGRGWIFHSSTTGQFSFLWQTA